LRSAASVARQLRGAQSAAFELMRGAGVVAPELAKLEQQRERLRYAGEKGVITFLRDSGRLRPELTEKTARDIFWMLTGGDAYRMLVRERMVSSEIPRLASGHSGALLVVSGKIETSISPAIKKRSKCYARLTNTFGIWPPRSR